MNKPIALRLWISAVVCFCATLLLSQLQKAQSFDQPRFLVPPPEGIEYFHFGFRESVADTFWLRWVQDSDVCQTYLKQDRKLRDAEALKNDPLLANEEHQVCDNSWSFKMLDTVTKLAPRFQMAYLAGGSLLAVANEDYAGATVIFDRGVAQYPDDWPMLYRAAYHFLYDTRDLPKAASLLERASEHGAPDWLKSLASRIYTRAGQLELGISSLEAYRKTIPESNTGLLKHIDKRLSDLRAKLANGP